MVQIPDYTISIKKKDYHFWTSLCCTSRWNFFFSIQEIKGTKRGCFIVSLTPYSKRLCNKLLTMDLSPIPYATPKISSSFRSLCKMKASNRMKKREKFGERYAQHRYSSTIFAHHFFFRHLTTNGFGHPLYQIHAICEKKRYFLLKFIKQ